MMLLEWLFQKIHIVPPYTGGYTSFMKISTLLNQHDILPSWNYHVIAHELHHSIQLRYGYSVSGEPGNCIMDGFLSSLQPIWKM